MQVAQLGVRAPVAIAYALAPVVFLFLHVHTLIRFDMLAVNLHLLAADLPRAAPLEADRERTRALLANVEFVQVLASPPGSSFRSPLFRFMAWLILSGLPFGVLLAVQISFLRYQSEAITALHQACVVLDFAALFWFRFTLWMAGRKRRVIPARAFWGRMTLSVVMALLVLAFAVVYAGVPSAGRTTVGAEPVSEARKAIAKTYEENGLAGAAWTALKAAASQPLDFATCPWLGFGCRFLRLDHRTLLANTPPADVLIRLRRGKSDDLVNDLEHVEGLFLPVRTLRFADFTASRLYTAVLVAADLRGARLRAAQLQGASLAHAKLQGANLLDAELQEADIDSAQLHGASLAYAQLQHAYLYHAQLQGAYLGRAQLQGADIKFANLQGANFEFARAQGASLWSADLQGADLKFAGFSGAHLHEAQLQGANLFQTRLQGATLRSASLQGAILFGTSLYGADLRGIRLSQTAVSRAAHLGLADLRAASWRPIEEEEKLRLREIIDAFPVGEDWQRDGKTRLEQLIAPGVRPDDPPDFSLDGPLLVDNVNDPRWQRLDRARVANTRYVRRR
jgi:uncharacterized protein YjbI with pentapeptide repeats